VQEKEKWKQVSSSQETGNRQIETALDVNARFTKIGNISAGMEAGGSM
jgi:hypothetical protein